MTYTIIAVIVAAVVSGFWYSYYQSVKKLRAHDRETLRIMERDLDALVTTGANAEAVALHRERIRVFREHHRLR